MSSVNLHLCSLKKIKICVYDLSISRKVAYKQVAT